MKHNHCLSEPELLLHYYGELAANREQARHLADCRLCAERLAALSHDLAKLPGLNLEADAAAGTRMAARVSEQLQRRRRRVPALAASLVAACVLVITITTWTPQGQQRPTLQPTAPELATLNLDDDMPDIEFLEDLELLKELELLRQIEGV